MCDFIRMVVIGAIAFTAVPVAQSQTRKAPAAIATDLDISGIWNFATLTPREHPARFATRPFLTREEAAVVEEETLRAGSQRLGSGPVFDEEVWSERGHLAILNGRYLSSLVSDPADGRVPQLTQAAKARVADRAAALAQSNGPEHRTLSERCLRSASGPAHSY
jgi:hypothetical protein